MNRRLAVATRLADAHLGDLGVQAELAQAYLQFADLLTATGNSSEALPWQDKALASQRKMVEAKLARSRSILADGLRHHGITLQKCGRPAEAVSAFREAIANLEQRVSPTAGNMYDLACSQSLLSSVAIGTGSGLTTADGQAEADKAMMSLRRAVAAGWRGGPHASRCRPGPDPLPTRLRDVDVGSGHARQPVRPRRLMSVGNSSLSF